MTRWPRPGFLPCLGALLASCAGSQARPLTLSERTQCQLNVLGDIPVPSEVIYRALAGEPSALSPYLLQRLTPALVVDRLHAWRECSKGSAE